MHHLDLFLPAAFIPHAITPWVFCLHTFIFILTFSSTPSRYRVLLSYFMEPLVIPNYA
jgi:hypothetical protein